MGHEQDPLSEGPPLVGVTCCRLTGGVHPEHKVSEKYFTAITDGFGGLPLAIPALADRLDFDCLVDRLDGLFVTGSPTNIEPHHYDEDPTEEQSVRDPHRDCTSLPLIRLAIARGLPVFAVCRGIQELNVALGGSLHQRYQDEVPQGFDHRSRKDVDFDLRYRPAHGVSVVEGGLLHGILGETRIVVNSLHGQAVKQPGPAVTVEARADDGCIEAIAHRGAPGFVLGVQWHPEWPDLADPVSAKLFDAFGVACKTYLAQKASFSPAAE